MSLPFGDLLEKAESLLREGHLEEAIFAFTECIEEHAPDARVFYGRARCYFQLKNWPAALPDFSKSRQLAPDNLDSWVGEGVCLAMVNQVYEGIAIFEELLSKNPSYVRGRFQLGQLYYHLGVITKGHREMEKALTHRPTLGERRMIEQALKEQKTLDKN